MSLEYVMGRARRGRGWVTCDVNVNVNVKWKWRWRWRCTDSTVQYSTVTDITDMMEGDNNHDDDGNEQYGGYTY